MIFVNYGGGGYWFFDHSFWNGLTVAAAAVVDKNHDAKTQPATNNAYCINRSYTDDYAMTYTYMRYLIDEANIIRPLKKRWLC